jgi:hypothetical protein
MAKSPDPCRIYTLKVAIIAGPATDEFIRANPEVSRTLEMSGNQTLRHLHEAIFRAFDRYDEHMYEFQMARKPMGKGPRYGIPDDEPLFGLIQPQLKTEDAGKTTLNDLGLKLKQVFWYWFDFGDDWWHRVDVVKIEEKLPEGRYPKVTAQVGQSPPQYMEEEGEEDWDEEDEEEE